MKWVKNIEEAAGVREGKPFKATLFQSERLLLGINSLEAGQVQKVHDHQGQDKFYLVQKGRGNFQVGGESFSAGEGEVIWAPAGVPHGVENSGPERLLLVIGIAPSP